MWTTCISTHSTELNTEAGPSLEILVCLPLRNPDRLGLAIKHHLLPCNHILGSPFAISMLQLAEAYTRFDSLVLHVQL